MPSMCQYICNFFKNSKKNEIENLILNKNTDGLFEKLEESVRNNDTKTASLILASNLLNPAGDYKLGLAALAANATFEGKYEMVQLFITFHILKNEEIEEMNRVFRLGESTRRAFAN